MRLLIAAHHTCGLQKDVNFFSLQMLHISKEGMTFHCFSLRNCLHPKEFEP
jgi:hypothetical protein